jgi:DNA-binding transcriptional ArsR family regulator
LTAMEKISDAWSTAGIGIIVAIILFVMSLKISEASTSALFVLLDDRRRRILEILERERDTNEIAAILKMTSDDERSTLISTLNYLKRRKFIKEKKMLGKKKFIRSF